MNNSLLNNNYLIIPNFISKNKALSLAKEFGQYAKDNNLSGDDQAENSHSSYNYISFLELLCEKTPEISSILEETVLPTYSYARIYKNSSILENHTDRDACEISLTIHLDGDQVWPICIETPSGEHKSVCLNSGDAMLYFGCTAKHWREKYFGEEYIQVFLHYVRSRGKRFHAYFDMDNPKENNLKPCNTNANIKYNIDTVDFQLIESSPKENNNLVENVVEEKVKSPTIIIPKSQTKLEDFIHVFDDVMPEHLCDSILKEYKDSNQWQDTVLSSGEIDKSYRNSCQISMSSDFIINENYELRKSLDESIFVSVSNIKNRYSDIHPSFYTEIDTGYQLIRYKEGEFFREHTDSYGGEHRTLSCSIQLNEDYDGGEFAFFDREIMIRSKKGSAIVFPSNFMYLHEVMPVIRGTRYTIMTWMV